MWKISPGVLPKLGKSSHAHLAQWFATPAARAIPFFFGCFFLPQEESKIQVVL
jgi:hypothetical protein